MNSFIKQISGLEGAKYDKGIFFLLPLTSQDMYD